MSNEKSTPMTEQPSNPFARAILERVMDRRPPLQRREDSMNEIGELCRDLRHAIRMGQSDFREDAEVDAGLDTLYADTSKFLLLELTYVCRPDNDK